MRLRTFLAVAFSILLSAPLMADALKIESDAQGVKVHGKQFSATAARVAYDEEKCLLTLDGSKQFPAMFIRTANGKSQITKGERITYRLKDDKLATIDLDKFDEARTEIPSIDATSRDRPLPPGSHLFSKPDSIDEFPR